VTEELDTTLEVEGADDDAEIIDGGSEDEKVEGASEPHRQSKKNSRRKTKAIRSITFDRQSLSKEFITDPPINADKVSMTITFSRSTGNFTVSNMTLLERNEPIVKAIKYNLCEGFVLLEPVHTAFKESKSKRRGFEGGGWRRSDEKVEEDTGKSNDDGIVMLLADPGGIYKPNLNLSQPTKEPVLEELESNQVNSPAVSDTNEAEASKDESCEVKIDSSANSPAVSDTNEAEASKDESYEVKIDSSANSPAVSDTNEAEASKDESCEVKIDSSDVEQTPHIGQHVSYTIESRGNRNSADGPKRGDLVTFAKGKNGKARDVRVKTKSAASRLKGKLIELNAETETAVFQSSVDKKLYDFNLKEVVSCEAKLLKKDDPIEGLLHDGKLVGICRNADLYLQTTITTGGRKERPRLNLNVKNGLGGKIIAQSCMAKGPDDSLGFPPGWTSRTSRYAPQDCEVEQSLDSSDIQSSKTTLNKDAEPFVL